MNITTQSPEKFKKGSGKDPDFAQKLWILPLKQSGTHGPERKIQFRSHCIYLHSTQMRPCNHRVVATTSQLIEKPGRQVTLTRTKNTSSYFQTQLWLNIDESRWSLSYSCPTLQCGFSTPSRQVALMPIQWWYSCWCIFYWIPLGVAIKLSSMLTTWEMRVFSNIVLYWDPALLG